jgi:hypothetical protein
MQHNPAAMMHAVRGQPLPTTYAACTTTLLADCRRLCMRHVRAAESSAFCAVVHRDNMFHAVHAWLIKHDFTETIAACRRLRAGQQRRCEEMASYMANCIKVRIK